MVVLQEGFRVYRASEVGGQRIEHPKPAAVVLAACPDPNIKALLGGSSSGQNKFRALELLTSKLEFRATLLQEAAVKYPSHAINIPRTSEATQAAQPWTTSCFWIPRHLSSSHLFSTRPSSSHPFSSLPSSTHPSSSHPSSTRKNCPEAVVRAKYLLDSRPLKLETKTPCQAFWARKLGIVPKPKPYARKAPSLQKPSQSATTIWLHCGTPFAYSRAGYTHFGSAFYTCRSCKLMQGLLLTSVSPLG